jgi:hypothetical protein
VALSDMPNGGFGVWTRQAFSTGTMFGPYGGVKVFREITAHNSGYSWEVDTDDENNLIY